MAVFEKLAKLGKSIKGLFAPEVNVRLTHLQEAGEKTMRFSGKALGKDGKAVARIEQYTQPVKSIGSDGTVLANTAIDTRMYTPAADSRLNKLGVEWVETTRTPYGTNAKASVKTHDGHRVINGYGQIRNYIQLMK